jgi:hypothetical protein
MHYGTANALKREGMIKGLIHEATALKQERVTLKHERHQIQIRKEEAILSKALLANAPVLPLYCFVFGAVRAFEAIVPVLRPWLRALFRLVMYSCFRALAVEACARDLAN